VAAVHVTGRETDASLYPRPQFICLSADVATAVRRCNGAGTLVGVIGFAGRCFKTPGERVSPGVSCGLMVKNSFISRAIR